ncbi:MAG TPA: hypothetical protein VEF76_08535 [Patescibacteria group bacterium]|nr:hypothetical protein [Patescibacteria group bacterium]
MSTEPANLQDLIRQMAESNPAVIAELGGADTFNKTLQNIGTLDQKFEERGGVFFHTGSDAFDTAAKFTQLHVEEYRSTGRPSLPALAAHHAEKLGLDAGSPEYKAMMLVAARAEVEMAVTPDYHNKFHYTDVAAMTANFLEKNDAFVAAGDPRGVPLTKEEKALTFITAIGHDIDHAGKSNPKEDPLFNEKKSFAAIEPLLKEAGLSARQIADVHTILMTTSPNGPHAVLKSLAKGDREGAPATLEGIRDADAEGKKKMGVAPDAIKPLYFDELKGLEGNGKLIQMAAMLSDADLYASSGAGMTSSMAMSTALTAEGRKFMGLDLDFTTDKNRKFFLDQIVGTEGYASNAGRAVANDKFMELQQETNRRVAFNAAAAPPPAAEAPSKFMQPAEKAPAAVVNAAPTRKTGAPKPGGM